MWLLTMTVTGFLAFSSAAVAQSPVGDAERGLEFVRKACAECHHVEKGQKRPKLSLARPFQEIANDPARTALSLRVFLTTPHRDMPNFILPVAEMDDVIAYILSLK